eukprot:3653499-Amphidinium_carterae.1
MNEGIASLGALFMKDRAFLVVLPNRQLDTIQAVVEVPPPDGHPRQGPVLQVHSRRETGLHQGVEGLFRGSSVSS